MTAGNGRGNILRSADELVQRLTEDGVEADRAATIEQPNPPRTLMMANLPAGFSQSSDRFDDIDGLAADVHASIKKRGDRFDHDEQLEQWLAEAGISYEPEQLRDALEQLEVSGWLSRPHRNRDWPSDPLPGYLVPPSWAR
jgi:hypothetical protein